MPAGSMPCRCDAVGGTAELSGDSDEQRAVPHWRAVVQQNKNDARAFFRANPGAPRSAFVRASLGDDASDGSLELEDAVPREFCGSSQPTARPLERSADSLKRSISFADDKGLPITLQRGKSYSELERERSAAAA